MLILVANAGLVERGDELARLERLLDQAHDGTGIVAVVQGPAGIGKSELLSAAAARADKRGFGVLSARGSEFESEMAFGVARQLFEPMLRSASPAQRRRLLDGVARVGAHALDLSTGEPPVDGLAAIHGLYWLCANRAELGPVAIVVDDAQWVDGPSLAWLGYLARRVEDLTLLLMLALRSGDPGGDRPQLMRLVADRAGQRIALPPLSADGVAAIVRARLDPNADYEFCATCRELTGGNPLFVRELLAAAATDGLPARAASAQRLALIAPAAIGTSVLARLGRLGADAIALARAVAVLGPGAEVAVAASLAELDPAACELVADRLAAVQIFAPARPLACAPTADAWVIERLNEAAGDALERGAPEVAAACLRRSLSEPPAPGERTAVLLSLGTAEWRAGQPDAIVHLEQALALAGDDLGTRIAVTVALALALLVSDRGTEAVVDVLEQALAAAGNADPGLVLTLEAAAGLAGMLNDRTAPAALARAARLWDRLGELANPPLYLLVLLASYAARDGRAAEARALVKRAIACEPYPPALEVAAHLIAQPHPDRGLRPPAAVV